MNMLKEIEQEALDSIAIGMGITVETEPEKTDSPGIELNLSWFLFYGRMLNMTKQEIMCTRYGEMLDMISCFSIQNGAKPKRKKENISF